MKMQIIMYPCCRKMFAACVEPDCYIDKDWQRDLRKYVKEGCVVETVDAGTVQFGTCSCANQVESQESKDENQLSLFNQ